MKKVVFLLCLFLGIIPVTVAASGPRETFSCNDSEIEVFTEVHSTGRKITITKNGVNPFQVVKEEEGIEFFVNDVLCTESHFVLYGYIHEDNGYTYYDSFLLAYDSEGTEVFDQRTDYYELEEIKSVFYYDQTYIVFINQTFDNGQYEHLSNYIEFYDYNFELKEVIEIEEEIQYYEFDKGLLLVDLERNGSFEYAITSDAEYVYPGAILDVEESYIGEMELMFLNEATLNGDIVTNGFGVDYPGVYQLDYNNQIYDFVVHPVVVGVENGAVYTEVVAIDYTSGNGLLNGDPYISGTDVFEAGNYEFKINGINGYSKIYEFTIVPEVTGVVNGHSYEEVLNIEFDGDGYLNNNYVTSPLVVEDEGDYVLKVTGVNGYLDTYQFTVLEETEEASLTGIIDNLDIFLVVIVVITGVIFLRKK